MRIARSREGEILSRVAMIAIADRRSIVDESSGTGRGPGPLAYVRSRHLGTGRGPGHLLLVSQDAAMYIVKVILDTRFLLQFQYVWNFEWGGGKGVEEGEAFVFREGLLDQR